MCSALCDGREHQPQCPRPLPESLLPGFRTLPTYSSQRRSNPLVWGLPLPTYLRHTRRSKRALVRSRPHVPTMEQSRPIRADLTYLPKRCGSSWPTLAIVRNPVRRNCVERSHKNIIQIASSSIHRGVLPSHKRRGGVRPVNTSRYARESQAHLCRLIDS